MSGPRVLCVGANLESEVVLDALVKAHVSLAGVVTLPSRVVEGVSDYRDLHSKCEAAEIPVIDTMDINDKTTVTRIEELTPDYIFVLGWSQLLGRQLLSVPSQFTVGSHPTPLPARRGRAPVPWTILEDCRESAVTLFRITPGVDDGPILLQRWFTLPQRPYAIDVYRTVADTLAEGFLTLYRAFQQGKIEERQQSSEQVTYRAKRVPADGHIDFTVPADAVDRLVRAVSEPFPGAYSYYEDAVIHVWRAEPYTGPERKGVPGQILAREEDWLIVQAGDAPVRLGHFTENGAPQPAGRFHVSSVFGYRVEDTLADLRRRVDELERKRN